MKLAISFLVMAFLLMFVAAEVEEFGFSNPNLPILGGGGSNVSLVTVNNSLYWNGFAYSPTRWLDIDGGNANQDVDIGIYDMYASAFIGDGSGLTNLPTSPYPHDQNLNTTDNVTFDYLTLTNNLTAKNGTFEYLNVTQDLFVSNSTIYLGNISMSSGQVEGIDTLFIPGTEVRATYFVGDGSKLTNITFENGTVIANAVNASSYLGGNFTGDNYTGLNFFGGNFYGTYDLNGVLPWIIFDGKNISFNESYLNNTILSFISNINTSDLNFTSFTLNGSTITDWSQVNYTTTNDTVVFTTPSFSGSYSTILPEIFSFEIAQIIVTPSTTTGNYRFGMYELGGETIDADLISHTGTWNIFKSYPINNQVSLNFSGVTPAKSFDITIKYFASVAN